MASQTAETSLREIVFDRLPEAGPSLEVLLLDNVTFHADDECGPTRPHRHDYHELIWTREGAAEHLIDGEVSLVVPNEITLIGRSQVHVFERARGLSGAVLRFGEELLHDDAIAIANPSWLAGSRLLHKVAVPAADVQGLQSLINTLAEETQRATDSRSVELQRHLLATLLLWVERWFDSTGIEQRDWDGRRGVCLGGMAQSMPCLVGGTVSAEEVDRYLGGLEQPKRSSLQALRRTILEIIPDAEEVISYRVPAFRVGGATVAGFAAFKNHLSYLPFSGSVLPQFADELEGYTMTKSALHFPVDRPLAKGLVKKLIDVRLAEAGRRSRS